MSNMKFKIGDRVRVVSSSRDSLPVGTEATIATAIEGAYPFPNDYQCVSECGEWDWYLEQDLAPIDEPAQHYIYLGRIDGRLWLAGPTAQEKPAYKESSCFGISTGGIMYEISMREFRNHLATLPRIEYLGQETDFQMYQAVRAGVDFEWFHQHLINGKWTFLNYPNDIIDDTRTVAVSMNRLIKK